MRTFVSGSVRPGRGKAAEADAARSAIHRAREISIFKGHLISVEETLPPL